MAKLYIGNNPAVLGMYDNGVHNQDKTITANGTYTADSGYTGLGTVTVNTPTQELDYNDAEFDSYCETLEDDIDWEVGTTQPASYLINKGWQRIYAGSSSINLSTQALCFIIPNSIAEIYLQSYYIPLIKSQDYTVTDIEGNNYKKITFTGSCRTLLCYFNTSSISIDNIFTNSSAWVKADLSYTGSYDYQKLPVIRGLFLYLPNMSLNRSDLYEDRITNSFRRYKIKLGTKLDISSYNTYSQFGWLALLTGGNLPQKDVDYFMLNTLANYTPDTYYTLSSSNMTGIIGATSAGYDGISRYGLNAMVEKIPFIFDYSSVTTSTFYIFASNSYNSILYSYKNSPLKEFRIILPSSPSDIYFVPYGTSIPELFTLSLDSWQYLAQNAPTVTGTHTIHTGTGATAYMLQYGSNAWQQVKTDLEAKGWSFAFYY